MTDRTHIKALLERYLLNQESPQEKEQLLQLIVEEKDPVFWESLFDEITEGVAEENPAAADPAEWQPFLNGLMNTAKLQEKKDAADAPVRRIPFMRRWGWVAASVIALLGLGVYFLMIGQKNAPSVAVANKSEQILPGKDGAILTLADGSVLVLDSLGNGVIATQNGAKVLLNNGQIVYSATAAAAAGSTAYNTITTPKGRQFTLVLPDGTKVWLNAASSLRYPTVFAGKERRVEVVGEAYFEVEKNPAMPFLVNVNKKAFIEVLGTHFNVNAYDNEQGINTTLLEGKVKVVLTADPENVASSDKPSVVLKPGQQATIGISASAKTPQEITVVDRADIDKVIAWKNGLFDFENTSLVEVMRQVERWYDIEVVYEKGIPDIRFGGKISRNLSLAGLLRSLEESEVNFRLEGNRKLIITP